MGEAAFEEVTFGKICAEWPAKLLRHAQCAKAPLYTVRVYSPLPPKALIPFISLHSRTFFR